MLLAKIGATGLIVMCISLALIRAIEDHPGGDAGPVLILSFIVGAVTSLGAALIALWTA